MLKRKNLSIGGMQHGHIDITLQHPGIVPPVACREIITPVLFKNLAVYTTRGSIAHPTDYIDWFLIPPADETAEG